jgi:triacylglycerol lipase
VQRLLILALLLPIIGMALAGRIAPVQASTSTPVADAGRAVVIVSGVGAISPFTTPTEGCKTGLSAGNTDTFLREYLLAEGFQVYTSPAMSGPGPVVDQTTDEGGPFGDCPPQPPAELTVNEIDSAVTGGAHLAAFINHLHDEYGVQSIDLVAHSLGGALSRIAIADLQAGNSPVTVRSLTTLGSPWESVMLANPTDPADPISACDGLEICSAILEELLSSPSTAKLIEFFQPEPFAAWTEAQTGVLDEIPVTLIAGGYFTKDGGNPDKWPNDGLMQERAALALRVSDEVLPHRTCHTWETFTHSLFISRAVGLPDEQSITWNADVAEVVANAIRNADTAMQQPTRQGCPTP